MIDFTKESEVQYGCAFCRTGLEKLVAHELALTVDGIRATPISQIKHKSVHGLKTTLEQILLPGYVFLASTQSLATLPLRRVHGMLKFLYEQEGNLTLTGQDRQFAEWVFANDGVITMSKALAVGDKIQIVSGPLKDYEGSIKKLDKRSRNGLVELKFHQKIWKVWLAYEMMEVARKHTVHATASNPK